VVETNLLAIPVVFAALAAAAQSGEPVLRTAAPSHGHIVVAFSPGDLIPGEIAVATRASRGGGGGFVRANIRLRERISAKADPRTGIVRFKTVGTLRHGTYFVAVSGFQQDPPASCFPLRSHCAERWSSSVRVVVPEA
jgi:hypothetical protein